MKREKGGVLVEAAIVTSLIALIGISSINSFTQSKLNLFCQGVAGLAFAGDPGVQFSDYTTYKYDPAKKDCCAPSGGMGGSVCVGDNLGG